MNRLLVFFVVVGALLVGTNPSRVEFNSWAQSYVARKIEDEARKRGDNPNDGASQIGGAIAGFVISNMPIDRRNFLAFSVYSFRFPDARDDQKTCYIAGIAGQFVPVNGCDFSR